MRILSSIFFILTLISCTNHTYNYYEFESEDIVAESGILKGSLKGVYKKISVAPDITNFSNPYSLIINFSSNDRTSLPVAIKDISILTENGAIFATYSGKKMNLHWSKYHKKWTSSWLEEQVELEHKIVVVRFNLEFIIKGDTQLKKYSLIFKPVYRQEKNNNFWDALMSV